MVSSFYTVCCFWIFCCINYYTCKLMPFDNPCKTTYPPRYPPLQALPDTRLCSRKVAWGPRTQAPAAMTGHILSFFSLPCFKARRLKSERRAHLQSQKKIRCFFFHQRKQKHRKFGGQRFGHFCFYSENEKEIGPLRNLCPCAEKKKSKPIFICEVRTLCLGAPDLLSLTLIKH